MIKQFRNWWTCLTVGHTWSLHIYRIRHKSTSSGTLCAYRDCLVCGAHETFNVLPLEKQDARMQLEWKLWKEHNILNPTNYKHKPT